MIALTADTHITWEKLPDDFVLPDGAEEAESALQAERTRAQQAQLELERLRQRLREAQIDPNLPSE